MLARFRGQNIISLHKGGKSFTKEVPFQKDLIRNLESNAPKQRKGYGRNKLYRVQKE